MSNFASICVLSSFCDLKNDSSGDFQHPKQFKFQEKNIYLNIRNSQVKTNLFSYKSELQMFFPISGRYVGAPHGVSILSSINLCGKFCQKTRVQNTAQTRHLDRFLIYLSSITCKFLDFFYGMVSIFFQWRVKY